MSKGIKPIWWLALVGVAGLAWWSSQLGQADTAIELQPARAEQGTASSALPSNTAVPSVAVAVAAPADDWLAAFKPESAAPPAGDPFHSAKPASRLPAPPPPAPPMPAPAPIAPPSEASLPFQYLGKLERNGRLDIYLDLRGSPLIAHVGEVVPEGWRLERFDGAGLTFIHLGTQRSQVLALGATP